MNKIFIFLGPSGSGKTTLAEILVKNYPNLFYKVVTSTTRAPRFGEEDKRDYYFLNEENFKETKMAEFEYFAGNYYGTPISELEKTKNILLVVEPKGAVSLSNYIKTAYPNKEIIIVYFNINEETRKINMLNRGDSLDKVEARLAKDNINQLIKDLKININLEFKKLENIDEKLILALLK